MTKEWSYSMREFQSKSFQLTDLGEVVVLGRSFKATDAIDFRCDGLIVIRNTQSNHDVVVRRPSGVVDRFSYSGGMWHRILHEYRVGKWWFWIRDICIAWGPGVIFLVLAGLLVAMTVIVALWLFYVNWIRAAVATLITLIVSRWFMTPGSG